jgi:tRNA A58 N-methylase Trm61
MLSQSYLDAIELLHLAKFDLYVARDDLAVSAMLRQDGIYEPHVTAVLERHVRPGMFVVDIGANIGYLTMYLAMLVGPSGRVVAVEPNPENVVLIEASRRANGFDQVSILQCAAGSENGLLTLNVMHCNGMT